MRREERVTVQGPVKKQHPDRMAHSLGMGRPGPQTIPPPLPRPGQAGAAGVPCAHRAPPRPMPQGRATRNPLFRGPAPRRTRRPLRVSAVRPPRSAGSRCQWSLQAGKACGNTIGPLGKLTETQCAVAIVKNPQCDSNIMAWEPSTQTCRCVPKGGVCGASDNANWNLYTRRCGGAGCGRRTGGVRRAQAGGRREGTGW